MTAFRRNLGEALPVTDSRSVLVGIVTADDVLLLSEREATIVDGTRLVIYFTVAAAVLRGTML